MRALRFSRAVDGAKVSRLTAVDWWQVVGLAATLVIADRVCRELEADDSCSLALYLARCSGSSGAATVCVRRVSRYVR